MAKELKNLIPDINKMLVGVISGGTSVPLDDSAIDALGQRIAEKLKRQLRIKREGRPEKTLYMSEIGNPCLRSIYYNHQERGSLESVENISPSNLIKFLYGDVVEELILELVRLSGHEVSHEQLKVEMELLNGWKLIGKLDAVIDGHVVDVKSASGFGMKKFEDGLKLEQDAFGYINQLTGYIGALREMGIHDRNLSLIGGKDGAFLAVDKSAGKLVLDAHSSTGAASTTSNKANTIVRMLEKGALPDRGFKLEEHTHGLKLNTNCSYCPFKYECWKDSNDGDGLRTFIYSNGPVYLARTDKEPKVTEITEMIKEAHAKRTSNR